MKTEKCSARQESLPASADYPEADVVIFDGNCQFCRNQVQRLAAWDGRGRLAFVSLHDRRVDDAYPGLTQAMLMEQMFVVDRTGRRHGGAAAVRYLTRRLPRLWLLAPALHIPFSMPIWQWLYRRIARSRYGLASRGCDEDTCTTHLR